MNKNLYFFFLYYSIFTKKNYCCFYLLCYFLMDNLLTYFKYLQALVQNWIIIKFHCFIIIHFLCTFHYLINKLHLHLRFLLLNLINLHFIQLLIHYPHLLRFFFNHYVILLLSSYCYLICIL